LEYQFTISLLITCISAETYFKIGRFLNFRTSVTLTLDRVIWHTIV